MNRFIFCLLVLSIGVSADFCEDTKSTDVIEIPADLFECEKELLKTYAQRWAQFAYGLDFNNQTDLVTLYNFMQAEAVSVGLPYTPGQNIGGFIFTKTTGDILIDATLPADQAIYPNIVTHGGRYEFSKAQLCREEQIVVYNAYWVPRVQNTFRFYAQAYRAGITQEWMTFRIHIQNGFFAKQCPAKKPCEVQVNQVAQSSWRNSQGPLITQYQVTLQNPSTKNVNPLFFTVSAEDKASIENIWNLENQGQNADGTFTFALPSWQTMWNGGVPAQGSYSFGYYGTRKVNFQVDQRRTVC